jgi:hypothetical protein
MSMTAHVANQREPDEDKASDAGDSKVHRLLDILTQEVSLVNRAANRQRWLVRKGSDEMLEVTENADGTLSSQPDIAPEASAETVVDKTPEGVDPEGADLLDKVALPDAVKQSLLKACMALKARLEALHGKVKEAEESDEAEEPTAVLMELKTLAMLVGGLMSKYPAQATGAKGGKEEEQKAEGAEPQSDAEAAGVGKAGHMLPPGYKGKFLGFIEQALSSLKNVQQLLDGAQEAEAGSVPMPPEVAKPLQAAHDALMAGYALGKGKAKTDDAEKASTPAQMLKEIDSTLGVVMAKLQPGKALDEDSYQRLDKLRSIVSSAMKNSGTEGTEQDPELQKADVEKAGAKMSTARRKRFQDAIKSLIALFKEVMPASELSKMPHLMVRKADEQPDPVLEEVRGKLAKAEQRLAATREELAALRAQPQASNVQQVPTTARPPQPAGQELWPNDLNSLHD